MPLPAMHAIATSTPHSPRTSSSKHLRTNTGESGSTPPPSRPQSTQSNSPAANTRTRAKSSTPPICRTAPLLTSPPIASRISDEPREEDMLTPTDLEPIVQVTAVEQRFGKVHALGPVDL